VGTLALLKVHHDHLFEVENRLLVADVHLEVVIEEVEENVKGTHLSVLMSLDS
jgi:hypothetical protein